MESSIKLLRGDCLELMKQLPNESIDMILCDLPYGTTRNKWDSVIPFDDLWVQYKRVIKSHGCIALFGQEPFSSKLRLSNSRLYRYDWYWKKSSGTGFLNANRMPLKNIETISIFYKHLPTYNPQFTKGKPYTAKQGSVGTNYDYYHSVKTVTKNDGKRYPLCLIEFNVVNNQKTVHPTQKPVSLLEYLIKTYTNEGMTVLDNCMGSGSTGVACMNTNRNFVGMELDNKYFNIAKERIKEYNNKLDNKYNIIGD